MQSFSEIELPPFLADSLTRIGFSEPTPIQGKAIPILLEGRDLMACAETGSGKTGAYLIPMVKSLLEDPKSQGLVLAPTRELAQQISEFLKTIVPDDRIFHTTRLVGGQDIRKQFKSLQKKPRVVVATPGRLIDHLKRNTIQIHKVNHLVIDEGDRMIDMGFAPQLKQILKCLPEKRQTAFFTATLDKKVEELTRQYLVQPKCLKLGSSRPVSSIKQSVVQVEFKDKDECILQELNQRSGSVIVFLKTKHRTDRLTQYLSDFGLSVDLIHGGRTQGQRNRAIRSFKNGKVRVLCATDVAARGIDVPHVEHVINFDLPMQDEDYVHRVGRTARNGAEGEAISFVTPNEHRDWNRLVKKYDIPEALLEEIKSNRKNDRGSKSRRKKSPGFSGGPRKKKSSFSGGPSRRKKSDKFGEEEAPRRKSRTKITADSGEGRSWKGKKKKSSSSRDEFSSFDSSKKKKSAKWGEREAPAGKKRTQRSAADPGEDRPRKNAKRKKSGSSHEFSLSSKKKSKSFSGGKPGASKRAKKKSSGPSRNHQKRKTSR